MKPREFMALIPVSRPGALIVLVILASLIVLLRIHPHRSTEVVVPADVTFERKDLELRAGCFYEPGSRMSFNGWVLDNYPDGSPRLRSAVMNGRLHGESTGWFTNGTLELQESFSGGLAEGTRTTWHPNGRKKSEGHLHAGRQQGLYQQWDEAGRLVAQAEFSNGRPHGLSLAWHPDGSLSAEVLMHEGEVRERHFYAQGERREPSLMASNSRTISTVQLK